MMANSFTLPKFRLFTIFAAAFLVGIAVASFIKIDFLRSWEILFFSIFALILAALFNFLFKNFSLSVVAIAFAMIFLGTAYYSFFEYRTTPKLLFDQETVISAKIISKLEVDFDSQKAIVKIIDSNKKENINSRILITLPHYPAYKYGDKIQFTGTILKPGMIENFDYGRYLKKSLVFGIITRPKNIENVELDFSLRDKVFRGLYAISDLFEKSLNRILPEPHASLASGLILGIKRNISDYFSDDLSKTGVVHIIALSGFNVAIILVILSSLLSGFFNKKQVFIIGSFLAIIFVLLTGAASSVVCAAVFSLLVIFGRTIGRQADFTNIMILAAVVMLLLNPFLLRSDVGFQLSFLAFAGIIYLSPFTQKIFSKKKHEKVPEFIKSPLAETLSAQILVTPLILTTFGRISFISPIANVLILWIVPLAMGLVFVAGLSGIISYALGRIVAFLLWPCLEFIIQSVTNLAKILLASLDFKNHLFVIGLSLYLIIAIYFAWSKRKLKIKIL